MKKIDRLFKEFPELKATEKWIRDELQSKSKHPIKWIYKRYTLRKPKRFEEAKTLLNSEDIWKQLWADMYLNMYYSGSAHLDYIGICFKELKGKEGFGNIIKNLKNSKQFFHTLSELEFNGYFANRYKLRLEPKIESNGTFKKLDSGIVLDKREILFEITTPDTYEPLKNSKTAITIPNRSKAKILDKLQRQIIPVKDSINAPLILVINTSYSDIDEYDIKNSVEGQLRLNFFRENKGGRIVHEYWDRDNNSISDTEPLSEYISAVVFYKRQIKYNGIFYSIGIIENPYSKYPLNAKEYKKIKRLNFRNIASELNEFSN